MIGSPGSLFTRSLEQLASIYDHFSRFYKNIKKYTDGCSGDTVSILVSN